ncbi:MAG: transposase [Firmicutes bacterium]|nr:transposase [Bacillota bacterium]
MLLYLTSWTEKTPFGPVRRSWKGYPFETLDELVEQGFIEGNRRAKSVLLTEAGEREARGLLARYGLSASELPEEEESGAARPQKPTERG